MRFAPASDAQEASLVLRSNGRAAFSIHLHHVFYIGREPANDLAITGDSLVSRNHARIVRVDDCFYVEDLSSTNGTYVNRERTQSRTLLKSGDIIYIGATPLEFCQGSPGAQNDRKSTDIAEAHTVSNLSRRGQAVQSPNVVSTR